MALTDQQIEQLFAFTKKKYVRFYDLQVELVDHLATSIEEEMAADPQLAFEHALQKVYNRFGIFGFAKVVQERETSLWKYNRKIWWAIFKSFFTIPRIALTAAIYFATVLVTQFVPADFLCILIFIAWLGFTVYDVKKQKQARKETIKPLMLTHQITGISFPGFFFPYYIFATDWAVLNPYFFAAFLTLIVVYELAIIKMSSELQKQARTLYPEAFVA